MYQQVKLGLVYSGQETTKLMNCKNNYRLLYFSRQQPKKESYTRIVLSYMSNYCGLDDFPYHIENEYYINIDIGSKIYCMVYNCF